MKVDFRKATPEDEPFLRRLFLSARPGLGTLPLPPEQLEQMVGIQYTARVRHYRQVWPQAEELIVLFEGEVVGALYLDRAASGWRIVDIAIVGDRRGCGIGTETLGWVLTQAGNVPVLLSVDCTNAAQRLYERLGFRVVSSDGLNVEMVHL